MGTAQQLLSSFSTEEVCLQRPTHAGVTCEEILMYMLREEAKNTAKNGAYSGTSVRVYSIAWYYIIHIHLGPLQVEFLSGVLHRPIQQVGEIEADIMNSQVLPCSCCQDVRETLAIMWLRFLPTSLTYNHIAPLIPGSSKCFLKF